MGLSFEASATCTVPTGFSGVPPSGPAMPVMDIARSAFVFLSAPWAMACAMGSLTTPCVWMSAGSTFSWSIFIWFA